MDLAKFAFFSVFFYSAHLTVAAPLCQDKLDKCSDYANYCGRYDNIRQQCPRTCNQCATIHPSLSVTPSQSISTKATTHTFTPPQSSTATFDGLVPEQIAASVSQAPSRTQTLEAFSYSLAKTQATYSVSQTQKAISFFNDFTKAQSPRDVLPRSSSFPTETTDNASGTKYLGEDRKKRKNIAIRKAASITNILAITTVSWMYAFLLQR
ncbi:uncharacterized protein LOC111333562 [Stylophora pistillata]|uniref:uncharacterized protein LOC111333562 n=1 Tax=Stylophora pistillata TaxID=50429 RepID=UPI000C0442FB|nr:uncharacterized protein LOC111333562 [Stylophora pistillata]